ncbi:hypothetical protein [Chryseobacterium sp. GP-SGM7]|uniref:hypothetical protein n=1 Tax=Chryseobacterium sp. GP-SGM7 TaxID=3411323 RepID=UPI003B962F54
MRLEPIFILYFWREMGITYQIRIDLKNNTANFKQVTKHLNVQPLSKFSDVWIYEINESEKALNFVDYFIKILNPHFETLKTLNIHRNHISFWILYEYQNQCNLELPAKTLKLLGDSEIDLCISCWEK